MIIDFQFIKTKQADNFDLSEQYEVEFSIAGVTYLDQEEIIKASQPGGSAEHLRQEVLAELVALLQLELYGRVMSNEKEAGSNQQKPNSQTSPTNGGVDKQNNSSQEGGSSRSYSEDDPTSPNNVDWEAEAEALETLEIEKAEQELFEE